MSKPTVQDQINRINELAEQNDLFWVAAAAKELHPILVNHLDELEDSARLAVEHYAGLDECDEEQRIGTQEMYRRQEGMGDVRS